MRYVPALIRKAQPNRWVFVFSAGRTILAMVRLQDIRIAARGVPMSEAKALSESLLLLKPVCSDQKELDALAAEVAELERRNQQHEVVKAGLRANASHWNERAEAAERLLREAPEIDPPGFDYGSAYHRRFVKSYQAWIARVRVAGRKT